MTRRKKSSNLSPLDIVAGTALVIAGVLFAVIDMADSEILRSFLLGAFYFCLIGGTLLFSFSMNMRAMAKNRRNRD